MEATGCGGCALMHTHHLKEDESSVAVANLVDETEEDTYMPTAVEFDPFSDAKRPVSPRLLLYAIICSTIVVAAVVGAAVGATQMRNNKDNNEEGSTSAPAVPYRESIGIREKVELVVDTEQLDESSSPYYKALEWTTHLDPMEPTPNQSNFLQRFFAAHFYFATSARHEWTWCNPAKGNETDYCSFFPYAYSDPYSTPTSGIRWLSNFTECTWTGIECDTMGQVQQIQLREYAYLNTRSSVYTTSEKTFLNLLSHNNICYSLRISLDFEDGFNLSGTFPDLSGFPFLSEFTAPYGEIEGPLPRDLSSLKHVWALDLTGNRISGTIPDAWYQSRTPILLVLSDNQITGSLSSQVNLWKDVNLLRLSQNRLVGRIPDTIGDLNGIRQLWLDANNFHGPIPASLGKLQVAEHVILDANQLTGPIPADAMAAMTSVVDFRASANQLTGSIPEAFWQLPDLERLDLSNNQLTGPISSGIGNAPSLWQLNVEGNNLNGQLPSELGLVSTLKRADFSGNDFTGAVGAEICNLRSGLLTELVADCRAPPNGEAEIVCPCCTMCCNLEGVLCLPV